MASNQELQAQLDALRAENANLKSANQAKDTELQALLSEGSTFNATAARAATTPQGKGLYEFTVRITNQVLSEKGKLVLGPDNKPLLKFPGAFTVRACDESEAIRQVCVNKDVNPAAPIDPTGHSFDVTMSQAEQRRRQQAGAKAKLERLVSKGLVDPDTYRPLAPGIMVPDLKLAGVNPKQVAAA